jgi:hypothetical protein
MIARAGPAGGDAVSSASSAGGEGLGPSGFVARLAAALVLVYATSNPFGFSYAHWVVGAIGSEDPESLLGSAAAKFVAGVVLAIGLSWSHVSRRLTGQIDTDEVDDG